MKQEPVTFVVRTFPVLKRNRQQEAWAREAYGGGEAHSPDCRVDTRGRRVLPAQQSKVACGLGAWSLTNEAANSLLAKV